MQGVVAAVGELGVHVDQVADIRDLGGKDDLVFAQPVTFGGGGVVHGGDDHRLHHDVARVLGIG